MDFVVIYSVNLIREGYNLNIELDLLMSSGENTKNDALIFVEVASLAYKPTVKESNIALKLFLRRSKEVLNNRIAIGQKQFKMNGERCEINEVGTILCRKQDYLQVDFHEIQTKINAYLRFPLQKLIQMPRVKHQIECKLIQKNWDRFFQGPLKNIVDVDMSIISFDHIIGKFVISSIQVELTRNTELIGEMDPYVQLKLQGEVKVTPVRDNAGKHCVWNQRIEFELSDINKGLILTLNVLDKDNLTSDLVGSKQVNLVEENMLIPQQEPKQKTFTLYFDKQSAGIIKVDYQFHPMPFNF